MNYLFSCPELLPLPEVISVILTKAGIQTFRILWIPDRIRGEDSHEVILLFCYSL